MILESTREPIVSHLIHQQTDHFWTTGPINQVVISSKYYHIFMRHLSRIMNGATTRMTTSYHIYGADH